LKRKVTFEKLKTQNIFFLIEKQLFAMVLIPLGWGVKS